MRTKSDRARGGRMRSRHVDDAPTGSSDSSSVYEETDASFDEESGPEEELDAAESSNEETESSGPKRRHRHSTAPERRKRVALDRSESVEPFSGEIAAREADETVFRLVRTVLARDSGHRYVRRENLLEASKGTRLSDVLPRAKTILADIYGVKLVPLEADKKVLPYVVTNCMTEKEKEILHTLWGLEHETHNRRGPTDEMYLVPKYNKSQMPVSNETLIKNGIEVLVLAVIVINENNVSEANLRAVLTQFGVPGDVNRRVSNLNMTIDDILGELVRKEFIDKQNMSAETQQRSGRRLERHGDGSELLSYRLGRRAYVEFSPMAFFKTIQDVYGDRFNEVKDKTAVTLQRCFKVTADQISSWSTPEPQGSANNEPQASTHPGLGP